MAIYNNLPGIFSELLDGNLNVYPDSGAPKFLILGTSVEEPLNVSYPYTVASVGDARALFGTEGTLIPALEESARGGASNWVLWRVGHPDDNLRTIYENMHEAYAFMYDQNIDVVVPAGVYLDDLNVMDGAARAVEPLGRFAVREVNGELRPAWWFPADPVDLTSVGSAFPGDNGATNVPTEALVATGYTGATGIIRFAALANTSIAYNNAIAFGNMVTTFNGGDANHLNGGYDVVLSQVSSLGQLTKVGDYYIHPGTADFFMYAYKRLPADAAELSLDDALNKLTTDNTAGLTIDYHYLDGASNSEDRYNIINTESLVYTDFHEVNFAYQLAEFCHRGSTIVDTRLGFIGVKECIRWGSAAIEARWVGTLPTFDADGAVTENGTGILGNKFLSGRKQLGSLPGFKGTADYKGAGGFFASDEETTSRRGYLDTAEKLDTNKKKIDIGKYISVTASWITFSGSGGQYNCNMAAAYAGFACGGFLPVQSAPTNKELGVGTLLGSITAHKLDLLAGQRVVGLNRKATKTVISDSPTAATPASDYTRISTIRQVEACVDGIRRVGEPFLGEGMTGAQIAALDTAVKGALQSLVQTGAISNYQHQVVVTPQMKILGQAIVQLKIVPAFELRQITVVVGLSAT
jgi:hypothetical protein